MHLVYQFQSTEDPTLLSDTLWKHKVSHRIMSNQGVNELWLVDASQLALVEQIVTLWKADPSRLKEIPLTFEKRTTLFCGKLKSLQ